MQKYPIVTISLINYNDRKFIFQAIESAIKQSYSNLEIIITDNLSTDGTREEIGSKVEKWNQEREIISEKAKFQTIKPQVIYIKNENNDGFGKPHNQAIRKSNGEFVLLLNSDALLKSDYVENAIKLFNNPKVGAVQGKLLRYDFDKNELNKSKENPDLNVIDTVGLMILKNRRIVCIGQGDADEGQYEKENEVFGADGAVPVYRKSALEDVKLPIIDGNSERGKGYDFEYFDENFFLYKEDVDLAWRLRLYGWQTIYTPSAVAYHGRGSGDSTAKNYIGIIKERLKINKRAKYLSFKHQRLMQVKDDFPSLLFTKHFPRFIVKEVGAWVYMAVFERFTFGILKDLYKDIPLFVKKRKMVMAKKRVSTKEMEKWFF
ncbi:MAG: glycosyltransferase family 2 protein [Candidatus Pacebacteria bacterium]|nr:glycosyltransferase family 2 protein [Candidatus Paceibacterota bacterium]